MKPRGPLMIEHRLIEKMLHVIGAEAKQVEAGKAIDLLFIDTAVDFMRIYADRTHHGKEEDILFKALEKKKLAASDAAIMQELVAEHQMARNAVKGLLDAEGRFLEGAVDASADILRNLKWLVDFYPVHIRKEDDVFFPVTEKYFHKGELQELLAQFWEFDRKMIHEKYANLVRKLEGRSS